MTGERWAVVLAGGVGSRFWPLSTPTRPKQLLPLVTDESMLANTVDRLAPLVDESRILVLSNATLSEATSAALPSLPAANIVAEPRPAGTAAALAWAAAEIERRAGPDAVMICVHADWAIGDPDAFRQTLMRAVGVAESTHGLVTVGIVPTRPDPGFGYIEPGEIADSGARHVARFVEKPTRERAAEMVAQGYLWNSGIFVWRVSDFLDQIRAVTPEVSQALSDFAGDTPDLEKFFAAVQSVSVDVGVLERSDRVFVLPGNFGWDDVGTWASLHRVREHDSASNVSSGETYAVDSTNNVLYAAADSKIVAYGVSDLVVVSRNGLTVVTTIEKSADLKSLIEALPNNIRDFE